MLLGQAESGKSTLRKQFQLTYASAALDRERPAWAPAVHLNVARAVAQLLDALDPSVPKIPPPGEDPLSSSSPVSRSNIRPHTAGTDTDGDVALRARLRPLADLAEPLARALGSGGVALRGVPCTRADWAALAADSPLGAVGTSAAVSLPGVSAGGVAAFAARVLRAGVEDIRDLWESGAVRELVKKREVVLDECADR
jgi:hypothetical protein